MSLADHRGGESAWSLLDGAVLIVGVVALVLAGVVTFGGSAADPIVTVLLPAFGPGFVGVAGLCVGGFALYTLRGRSSEQAPVSAVELPTPPSRRTEGASTAGGRIDRLLGEVHADDIDGDVSRLDASVSRKRVRDRIRRVAIAVIQDAESCSAEEAGRLLETGKWTDRRRAQVFLGQDVPQLPLSVRLRDWASGEGFRRRAAATVEAVAERAEVDVGESVAPPPVGRDGDAAGPSPLDWPPEPEATTSATEEFDRLLDRTDGDTDTTAETDEGPGPETDATDTDTDTAPESPGVGGAEVFRRTVVPEDVPVDDPVESPSRGTVVETAPRTDTEAGIDVEVTEGGDRA